MRIGSLRKCLSLQRESLVPDGAGGKTASWATIATVWGELTPLAGAFSLAANNDRRLTHMVRLRYSDDLVVTPGMRMTEGNRIFTVHGVVIEDEAGRWVEVHVEESGKLG